MKLKFYWYVSDAYKDGLLRPACNCMDTEKESDESLANYLTDDGGNFYFYSVSWAEEGLRKLSLLEKNEIERFQYVRDAWGADFSSENVKIYSLYDDDFSMMIPLKLMKLILLRWREFLQMKPCIETSLEIDLNHVS